MTPSQHIAEYIRQLNVPVITEPKSFAYGEGFRDGYAWAKKDAELAIAAALREYAPDRSQ